MEQKTITLNNGVEMPLLGYGVYQVSPDEAERCVADALSVGYRMIDTAQIYQNEAGVGSAVKKSGLSRDEVFIVDKIWISNFEGDAPKRSLDESLRLLGTDYIDLYFYHSPDPNTPIEETLSALDQLVRDGKVRYLGHSNFSGWQLAHAEHCAHELGTERFIAAENHYNLLDRRAELEILPAAQHFGMGVLPYFPLANGLLTGKYRRDNIPAGSRLSHSKKNVLDAANWDQLEAFHTFCTERGITEVQAAFSWLAQQSPVTSVIAGATSAEQVRANAQAACLRFDAEDLAALDAIFPAPEKIALF